MRWHEVFCVYVGMDKKKVQFKYSTLLEKQNAYVILLLCSHCCSKCFLQYMAPYTVVQLRILSW
jgi:F0F1-type ATP synthase alpha subunit